MFAGKKSAQIREILISESAWEEMTCLFAPSLNTFVIDPATARRFECVKEMVRKQGFNNITEPEIIDAILSEITAADAAGIFIEYKLKATKPLLSTD